MLKCSASAGKAYCSLGTTQSIAAGRKLSSFSCAYSSQFYLKHFRYIEL